MSWWNSEPAPEGANDSSEPGWTPDGQPMQDEPDQAQTDTSFADALNAERAARNAQAASGEEPKKWWEL